MTATISVRQQAYEHIRGKVVRGEFEPGERLSNRKLAREVGASFIPVREAISQLVSEGLVEHRPDQGAFVATLSRREIEDLYDLREALECHAAAKVALRVDPERGWLSEMVAACRCLDDLIAEVGAEGGARVRLSSDQNDRWAIADASFHIALLRAAGNQKTIETVNLLRVMANTFGRRNVERSTDSLGKAAREHELIVQALLVGDAPAASRAMAGHIQRGCKNALDLFDRHAGSGGPAGHGSEDAEASGSTPISRSLDLCCSIRH